MMATMASMNPHREKSWLRKAWHGLRLVLLLAVLTAILGGAAIPPGGLLASLQVHTRSIEFDYSSWTLAAIAEKFSGWALSLNRFLSPESQSRWVLETMAQVAQVDALSIEVLMIYSDPAIADPDAASLALRQDLAQAEARLQALLPTAEAILQSQLIDVLAEVGLDVGGQVLPPSLYHSSVMPYSLVVSPRDQIVRELDISLSPSMTTEGMEALEKRVFEELDRSALVVPIGGVGTYPTMIKRTSNLVWLTEVIAHEWVHNFLTLRPLGMNYYTSEDLRTINETTASLAGKELGRLILEKFYPDQVPPEIEEAQSGAPSGSGLLSLETEADVFDFRAEMRQTRIEVDRLLVEGEVEEAETYMEARRGVFWKNGYLIRKLNQAYFAFYGAYNDAPGGGAAGEDPIGPAVVAYRDRFGSLAEFLKAISWVDSVDGLMRRLDG